MFKVFIAAFLLLVFSVSASAELRTLQPSELKEDFVLMKRALTELHPGLYRYTTKDEFAKKFAEFEARLDKPMREDRFFLLTAQLLSEIRCGHTYLNPLNQNQPVLQRLIGRRTYIPFYFTLVDGLFVVTENASGVDLPEESAIVSINGRSVDEIVQGLISVSTADGDGTILTRLSSVDLTRENGPSYSQFDIYFPILFPLEKPEFEIRAINYKTREEVRFTVPAMTREERTAAMESRYGKAPGYDEGWTFRFFDDGTGYLKIDHFITWKLNFEYKEFLAGAFSQMREAGTKNLIVDIRDSEGGDAGVVSELLKYFHDKPFSCDTGIKAYIRTAQADAELLKFVTVYDAELKAALLNGVPKDRYKAADNGMLEFFEGKGDCSEIEPYKDAFQGETYLLIGPRNASAAFSLAKRVRGSGLATLVGRMTGGNLNGFNGGAYLFFYLPNSGFEFDIPVFAYYPEDASAARDSGVVPDVPVPLTIKDVALDRDPALTTVLEMIDRKRMK